MLVGFLLFELVLKSLAAGGRRQVGCVQPDVGRAANLFHRDPVQLIARRVVVFLPYTGTKEMTELRYEEVPMHAAPTTDFVVVQAEFFLPFAKATFELAAAEGHAQDPPQCD